MTVIDVMTFTEMLSSNDTVVIELALIIMLSNRIEEYQKHKILVDSLFYRFENGNEQEQRIADNVILIRNKSKISKP